MGNAGDTHCRQCGEGVETVRHILSQCRPKGFNLYMEWHDCALLVVYYDLCKHYGFEVTPRWWELQPLPVRENHCAKILWDVPIPIDGDIVAHHPDNIVEAHWGGGLMEMQEKAWVYLIPGTQVQADELPLCHLSWPM